MHKAQMKTVYMITDEKFSALADAMAASLKPYADKCVIESYCSDIEGINTAKMVSVSKLADTLDDDTLLLKLDVDMLIQANPFKAFDLPESRYKDILITSRQYMCRYQINGGFQGFRINARTREFLRFYAEQLSQKTWLPYKHYQMRNGRGNKPHFLDEQDFLCTVYEEYCMNHTVPYSATICDVGPNYNWTEVQDNPNGKYHKASVDRLRDKIGNSEYPMLHFKGGFKKYLPIKVEYTQRGKE